MSNPTDIAGVIRREHDALASETRIAQCPPIVAVNDMDDIGRIPRSLRDSHPTTVTALAGAKGAAFVVDCPSLDSTVLWVGTGNDDYRSDYAVYLNSIYKLKLPRVPAEYDVDHLYNRARAQMYGLQFIRVALVAGAVNRSHGASVEKDLTVNEALRVRKGMKVMDEIASMKYFGFLSPTRSNPRDSEIDAYATFAATRLGLDAAEVRQSVKYLRDKASTPWAKKP